MKDQDPKPPSDPTTPVGSEAHKQQELFTSDPAYSAAKGWIDPMLLELAQRYAYMFAPDNRGLQMYPGWYAVFAQLRADIDARLGAQGRNFVWVKLREKFGSARWYWRMDALPDLRVDVFWVSSRIDLNTDPSGNPLQPSEAQDARDDGAKGDAHAAIDALVDDAEQRTQSLCAACAAAATIRPHGGWLLACCDEHTQLLKTSPDEFMSLLTKRPQAQEKLP